MIYSLDSIKQIINEKNRKDFEAKGGIMQYLYKIDEKENYMENLGSYDCEKGSLVINGICLSNGKGDGCFDIYFFKNKDYAECKDFKNICENLWIDLRHTDLDIWTYDCDKNCEKINITKEKINVDALLIYKNDNGDFALVKYF